MELNILRIDLDIPTKKKAITELKRRISYLHDVGLLQIDFYKEIILLKKTSYGCKIILKDNFKKFDTIIILQLLLGSDWMKETNTLLNHSKYKMQYSNRLFDCKRYRGGKIKIAKKYIITLEIFRYIHSKRRLKYKN